MNSQNSTLFSIKPMNEIGTDSLFLGDYTGNSYFQDTKVLTGHENIDEK